MQNEEMTGAAAGAARAARLYDRRRCRGGATIRSTLGELPLRSFWVEGSVGYAATPWVRIEGFYAGTHQTIDRPGGELDRNRVGIPDHHRQTDEDPLMEDTHVHALDYLSVLRRRKWWLIVPIVASIGVGAGARALPAEAVQVERDDRGRRARRVAEPGRPVGAARQRGADARRLAAAAQPVGADARRPRSRVSPSRRTTRCSAACGRSVTISVPEPVATTNEPRRFDTFIVSYVDADPARAQRVANRLAVGVRRRELEDARSSGPSTRRRSSPASSRRARRASTSSRRGCGARRNRTSASCRSRRRPTCRRCPACASRWTANATALRGEQDRLSMIERQLAGA